MLYDVVMYDVVYVVWIHAMRVYILHDACTHAPQGFLEIPSIDDDSLPEAVVSPGGVRADQGTDGVISFFCRRLRRPGKLVHCLPSVVYFEVYACLPKCIHPCSLFIGRMD